MLIRYRPFATGAGLLLAASAQAQQPPALPQLNVTARPLIEESVLDPYSSTSSVVTENQLRDQNAVDVASALRRTPGVQISRYNPVGAFGGDQGGAVFIRGIGLSRPGSEITTTIDGIPFYMGVWNHPLLDLLPVNGMRSITVYKSPQPQISGNNFASVDLQTRRATEPGVQGDARVSAGSFGTFIEQANLLGRDGDLDYQLAQGHARSDGHRPNASGRLDNLMGRVGLKLGENWSAAVNLVHVDNEAYDPGDARVAAAAVAPRYETRATLIAATLSHAHGSWRGDLRVYSSHGDGNWLDQAGLDGNTLTSFETSGVRWKERFAPWRGGSATIGLDLERVTGDIRYQRVSPAPTARFDAPAFRLTSPYAAVSHEVTLNDRWRLIPSAGIRWYDHSVFGSEAAPHAGLSLASERLTLFLNASRGIHYPGLETAVLADLIPPLADSWRRLSAERMNHVEVGAKVTPSDATQIDLSLFTDRIENRYIFGFPPDLPPPPQFVNLGGYRMRGLELSVRHQVTRRWTVFSGVTWLDPSIDTLPYAPERALTLGINGNAGPVRVAFDVQAQSSMRALNRERAAGAVNTERVGGFAVANLRLSHPIPSLGRRGELFASIENLFDRDYAYRPGYAMPGRWGQVGFSASF